MGPSFWFVLALGTKQVGMHRLRRFDHGQQSLNQSLKLVTALTPAIGYDRACAIAKHAHNIQLSLREEAQVLGEISSEEFDRWVQPEIMLCP